MLPLLLPLITALAPYAAKAIGSALGGGDGKRIAEEIEPAVTAAALRASGEDTIEAAQDVLLRDPAKGAEFARDMQALATQLQVAQIQADLANVQGARQTAVDSGLAPEIFRLGRQVLVGDYGIGLLIVVGGLLLLSGVVPLHADPTLVTVVFTLLGTVFGRLSARADQVTNFYYGNTKGSGDKTNEITSTMRSMGEALGQAAQKQAALPAPSVPGSGSAAPEANPAGPAVAPSTKPPKASRFNVLVDRLLAHEGGYVDDVNDNGGCTNLGITLGTLRAWRSDPGLGCDAVAALTRDEAKQIYWTNYWNAVQADGLPIGLDHAVFDFCVNAGPRRSALLLQGVLARYEPSLKVDGIVGPFTLAACLKAPPADVLEGFHAAKMDFYRSLDDWQHFGNGWTRRADEVLAQARADMAAASALPAAA